MKNPIDKLQPIVHPSTEQPHGTNRHISPPRTKILLYLSVGKTFHLRISMRSFMFVRMDCMTQEWTQLFYGIKIKSVWFNSNNQLPIFFQDTSPLFQRLPLLFKVMPDCNHIHNIT